ncbi:MAG: hypothetical protein ACQJCO_08170 [cyanobacterium endosymbiont of Rhopalodia sterrenbergii]
MQCSRAANLLGRQKIIRYQGKLRILSSRLFNPISSAILKNNYRLPTSPVLRHFAE